MNEEYIVITKTQFQEWANKLIFGARNPENTKLVGIEMMETLEHKEKPNKNQIQMHINANNELEL